MRHVKKQWALAIAAGALTAGEAALNAGVQMPFADVIPGWARGLIFLAVVGGGFVLRYKLQGSRDAE